MIWSSLPREQRAAELAKHGITIRHLLADLQDLAMRNAEIAALWSRCKTEESVELLAFEIFGDLGRPQPTERTDWPLWGRTPDWPGGRLPEPEADATLSRSKPTTPGEQVQRLVAKGTHTYTYTALRRVVRLRVVDRRTQTKIVADTSLSQQDASRLVKMIQDGDLALDGESGELRASERVVMAGTRYVLRVWVDGVIVDPRPPRRGY